MAHFKVFRDTKGEWRWRLVAANGKIIAQSEGYTRRQDARKGARAVARTAPIAYIDG